jgi:hypothetical protein
MLINCSYLGFEEVTAIEEEASDQLDRRRSGRPLVAAVQQLRG